MGQTSLKQALNFSGSGNHSGARENEFPTPHPSPAGRCPNCHTDYMQDLLTLFAHLVITLVRLIGPGGARSIVAASLFIKHQLLIVNRSRQPAPNSQMTMPDNSPAIVVDCSILLPLRDC